MKNILSYDFNDASKNGLYSVDSGNNSLLIYLTPLNTQITNYIIEITDTQSNVIKSSNLSKNENGQLEYSVQESYFNGNAQMKIRLLSSEENSDYIIFNCLSFTGEDLLLKRVNTQYSFSIKLPASSYLYPPVGTQIYNSRKDFDPNEYYPGTKWVRIKGRVLAGINEDDNEATDNYAFQSYNQPSGTKLGSRWIDLAAAIGACDSNVASIGYAPRSKIPNMNYQFILTANSAWNGNTAGPVEPSRVNHSTYVRDVGTGLMPDKLQDTQLTYIWERVA